jgi:hypothetical protein
VRFAAAGRCSDLSSLDAQEVTRIPTRSKAAVIVN